MTKRNPIPGELRPGQLTAIIDTREQTPLDLAPLRTEIDTLAEGDYTLKGLETVVVVERKSLPDLVQCCGAERTRFVREVQRLCSYPANMLVIEATLEQIKAGGGRGNVSPATVYGSLISWQSRGLGVWFAGDHEEAGRSVARFLFTVARHRYHENRSLLAYALEAEEVANDA